MRRSVRWVGAALVLSGAWAWGSAEEPAASETAEEEEARPEAWGQIHLELESWVAQPAGLDYRAATALDPTNPFGTRLMPIPYGTRDEFRYVAAFAFRGDIGEARLTWFSHDDLVDRTWLTPSQFLFGTLTLVPFGAGFQDDGLADAVLADTRTQLRDLRLDFSRRALETRRLALRWQAGYRRVFHNRRLDADYFAVVPVLPPLFPPLTSPRPDLDPLADSARLASKFEGRGAEAGLEADFILRPGRLAVETGVTLAVLRGQVDSTFQSITHVYALVEDDTVAGIVEPPFDVFGTLVPGPGGQPVPFVDSVRQVELIYAVSGVRESVTSQVLETHLGFRWRVWRQLEARFGFRNIRYSDVGLDVRPAEVVLETDRRLDDFRLVDGEQVPFLRLQGIGLEQTRHSATYEGYYFGVGYTF